MATARKEIDKIQKRHCDMSSQSLLQSCPPTEERLLDHNFESTVISYQYQAPPSTMSLPRNEHDATTSTRTRHGTRSYRRHMRPEPLNMALVLDASTPPAFVLPPAPRGDTANFRCSASPRSVHENSVPASKAFF